MSSTILNDAGSLQMQRSLGNRFPPHPEALAHPFLRDEELVTVDSIESARQKAAKALFDQVMLAANTELRGLGDQGEHVTQQQTLEGAPASKLNQ